MRNLILIGGASGVGKTTVAESLARSLAEYSVLSQDNFCRDRNYLLEDSDFFALDHEDPDIIDHQSARRAIDSLLSGCRTTIPVYRHAELRPTSERTVDPGGVIYEGLHALYDADLVNAATLSVFLVAPESIVCRRRCERDIRERGVDPRRYDEYFHKFIWPGYERFVLPTAKRAQLILNAERQPKDLESAIRKELLK